MHPHRLSVLVASTVLLLVTGCAPKGTPWPGLADPEIADTGETSGNPFAGFHSDTYEDGDMWLCGPGASADHCVESNLDATEVLSDGSLRDAPHEPAAAPAIDCFYVYPTVELFALPGNVRNLDDIDKQRSAALHQAARLSEVCRVVAPLYHQATLASYGTRRRDRFLDRAYEDVEEAFKHYMAQHNEGRPFVLIGHSQGAGMISRLMQKQLDVHPALRDQLVVAMPIGGQLFVPEGETVGGSFSRVPVCTDDDTPGCVIGYRSFIAGEEPSRNVDAPEGYEEICVNPANIGGTATLSRSYFAVDGRGADVPEQIETPYALYADMYRARCETDPVASHLSLEVVDGDGRDNPISFDSAFYQGEMGLHIWDVHVALGDLIADIARRAARFETEPS
jgi:hypothetical protein